MTSVWDALLSLGDGMHDVSRPEVELRWGEECSVWEGLCVHLDEKLDYPESHGELQTYLKQSKLYDQI